MQESLERSRKKWLSEGIFERYWTKPTKRKPKDGVPAEEVNNPPKDSMTKIGSCTITIEPHVFDAIMYAVKDTTPKQPYQPPPQPLYRPIIQYGPPNGVVQQHQPQPQQPPHVHAPPAQYQLMQPSPQQFSRSQDNSVKTASPSMAPQHLNSNGHAMAHQTPLNTPNYQPAPPHPPTHPLAPVTPAAPAKSSDPVIQMLAERAATDSDLKALMRIVADGKASPDELKRFQGHIDELTKLLHQRQAAARAASPAPILHPQPLPPQSYMPVHHPAPASISARPPPPQSATPLQRAPYQTPLMNGGSGYHPPQPQALRSKGPPPSSKPDISAVVFEFVGGSGDRFLFPKFSILEYLPGGQVIASFLIVRKGSSAESKSYDPTLDYYQPVTIRLYTHAGKQLESLAKVVAPQEEVLKYMDDIMDNMTRAEYVLLAMRLPRDSAHPPPPAIEEAPAKNEGPGEEMLWKTSSYNVNVVQKQKPAKKIVSEEEQYSTFINTISG
jgi:hypothetical protein